MKTIIAFVAIVSLFIVIDVRARTVSRGALCLSVKLSSLAGAVLLMLLDLMLYSRWGSPPGHAAEPVAAYACDIMAGAFALSLYPGRRQDARRTLACFAHVIMGTALIFTVAGFLLRSSDAAVVLKTVALPCVIVLELALCRTLVMAEGYRKVVPLFSNARVWDTAVDASGEVYCTLLWMVPLLISSSHSLGSEALEWVALVLSVLLTGVFYGRASSGKTLFLKAAKEREIITVVKGSLRAVELEGGLEDHRMRAMYKKVMHFMEEKKPYLDNNVDLGYFARKLFTNKVYLSRTINVFSGRNFRQFINYHRVEHSVGLMKKDPYLRVEELAQMSGFNSAVSYNMAFRMFKGMTPKEWLDHYRDSFS